MTRLVPFSFALASGIVFAGSAAVQAQDWYTFNGDLAAQKYSTATQITPDNVGKLMKAWEVHTGDVSDGTGDKPASDWSATPLFVNNTIYLSTPFYRILALAPDTGKVKWTYDTKSTLKALTQPDLKTCGVAYWQSANPSFTPSLLPQGHVAGCKPPLRRARRHGVAPPVPPLAHLRGHPVIFSPVAGVPP